MLVNLTSLRDGERGRVVDIQGGLGLLRRLESLGIRPGVELMKVGSQLMRGPTIVKIGNSQVAIGFGMARKIIIEQKR